MRRLLLELKIAGINFPLVTAALSLALVLFAWLGIRTFSRILYRFGNM